MVTVWCTRFGDLASSFKMLVQDSCLLSIRSMVAAVGKLVDRKPRTHSVTQHESTRPTPIGGDTEGVAGEALEHDRLGVVPYSSWTYLALLIPPHRTLIPVHTAFSLAVIGTCRQAGKLNQPDPIDIASHLTFSFLDILKSATPAR